MFRYLNSVTSCVLHIKNYGDRQMCKVFFTEVSTYTVSMGADRSKLWYRLDTYHILWYFVKNWNGLCLGCNYRTCDQLWSSSTLRYCWGCSDSLLHVTTWTPNYGRTGHSRILQEVNIPLEAKATGDSHGFYVEFHHFFYIPCPSSMFLVPHWSGSTKCIRHTHITHTHNTCWH